MEDNDQKPGLSICIILGVGEYSKIKTNTTIRVGKQSEPIAEKTDLGWTITSPSKDCNVTSMMSSRNSIYHDQLWRPDVLGTEDSPTGDHINVKSLMTRWNAKSIDLMKLHCYGNPGTQHFTATKMEAYQD